MLKRCKTRNFIVLYTHQNSDSTMNKFVKERALPLATFINKYDKNGFCFQVRLTHD